MRLVSVFLPLVCGLALSSAPDLPQATSRPAAAMVGTIMADAEDAEYQALQRQADLALDALREARARRLAQLSAN